MSIQNSTKIKASKQSANLSNFQTDNSFYKITFYTNKEVRRTILQYNLFVEISNLNYNLNFNYAIPRMCPTL